MPKLLTPHPKASAANPWPFRAGARLPPGPAGPAASDIPRPRLAPATGRASTCNSTVRAAAAMPWGADRTEDVTASVRDALGAPGATVLAGPGDLTDPAAPAELHARATEALGGRLDILVANHALSGSDGDLDTVDAAMLDAHW